MALFYALRFIAFFRFAGVTIKGLRLRRDDFHLFCRRWWHMRQLIRAHVLGAQPLLRCLAHRVKKLSPIASCAATSGSTSASFLAGSRWFGITSLIEGRLSAKRALSSLLL